jgi:phosphoribosylformylglycinamidine synthase I
VTRVGVVQFPGTNCEMDTRDALSLVGATAVALWHGDTTLGDIDAVIVPGGFAHGDYLRPGAIARFSPVMAEIQRFAAEGGAVLGICNGFQVLTEVGLLPGALQKNAGLKFICAMVELEVASNDSVITRGLETGTRLRIPINHFEGNYSCDESTLDRLNSDGQVVMRYVDNPNGSIGNIAAIANEEGNVVGMMPHPERATAALLGSTDGLALLGGLIGG